MKASRPEEATPIPATARQHASFVLHEGAAFWLERSENLNPLRVMAPRAYPVLGKLRGAVDSVGDHVLVRGELSAENAAALRGALPNLRPRPLGLATSVGFGDRLSVATPGHVLAVQRHGEGLAPISPSSRSAR